MDGGWWAAPTVVTGVTHDMLLMTDETFGPIMPVMIYDDVEEAVPLANDSLYGLSGAVFAGAEDEAVAEACPRSGDVVQAANFGPIRTFVEYATDEQKGRFLPDILAGKALISLWMTELQTIAKPEGDG